MYYIKTGHDINIHSIILEWRLIAIAFYDAVSQYVVTLC